MKQVIKNSNIKLETINYINAHSTSTPVGDLAEITAIKRLFNKCSKTEQNPIYITSLKGSLGHLLGAAGAVETIFTILTCKEKVIPPSINIQKIDPAFKLEEMPFLKIVDNKKKVLDNGVRIVSLKNSFGFGGTNASLCISSFI